MAEEISIPEAHKIFCKAVAKLAREHGLRNFSGSFTPGFGDPWRRNIAFNWDAGRHGEDENQIRMMSTVDLHEKIDGPEKTVG